MCQWRSCCWDYEPRLAAWDAAFSLNLATHFGRPFSFQKACGFRVTLARYLEICKRRWLTPVGVGPKIPEFFIFGFPPTSKARGTPREPLSFRSALRFCIAPIGTSLQIAAQLNYTFRHKGGENGFARISSGRWMPVRGGALSAKGLALDGLQLPLQGLPAFFRSGMVRVDDHARRGF